jgi:hypothetical protein
MMNLHINLHIIYFYNLISYAGVNQLPSFLEKIKLFEVCGQVRVKEQTP